MRPGRDGRIFPVAPPVNFQFEPDIAVVSFAHALAAFGRRAWVSVVRHLATPTNGLLIQRQSNSAPISIISGSFFSAVVLVVAADPHLPLIPLVTAFRHPIKDRVVAH